MQIKRSRLTLSLGILILLFSCNRPVCENTNPIFNTYNPETKEYKEELVRQLQRIDNKELSYWFDKYESKNNKEYILVNIQGQELCAQGFILVNDWKKLEGIKRTQGVSYEGAELKGLTIDVTNTAGEIELLFKDLGAIID